MTPRRITIDVTGWKELARQRRSGHQQRRHDPSRRPVDFIQPRPERARTSATLGERAIDRQVRRAGEEDQ